MRLLSKSSSESAMCREPNFELLLLADNFLIIISCYVVIKYKYSVHANFCQSRELVSWVCDVLTWLIKE